MRWPKQKVFLSLLILLLLPIPVFSYANGARYFTGKVGGVSDGDTISVMRRGRAVKVHLHGIGSMGEAEEGERYVEGLCTFCTSVPQTLKCMAKRLGRKS